ncbi:MAG: hypothetical protein ILP02_02380 [Clostridia bacterium]|nr:hypothetical protein [Clostridia bacterium]
MIETVLKNVRQTEEAAQAIRLNAEIGAAEIRNEADKRAAEILSGAKTAAKERADEILSAAAATADENDARSENDCRESCVKLKTDLEDKVEALAERVFGGIKDGC